MLPPQTPEAVKPSLHSLTPSLLSVTLSALLGTSIWLAGQNHLLDPAEARLLSLASRLSPSSQPTPVTLVLIQDPGEQGWPWSSLDYAIFLNAVAPLSPEITGLSVPLQEGDPLYPIYDIQLGKQIARLPNVLLSATPTTVPAADTLSDQIILQGQLPPKARTVDGAQLPLPEIRRSTSTALQSMSADSDGVVRRIPLIFSINDKPSPSFLLQLYAGHLHSDWSKSECTGREIILRGKNGRIQARIPLDEQGCMLLQYDRPTLQQTGIEFYLAVIAAEQIRNGLEPAINLHEVRRQILLLGPDAPGTFEPVRTPLGLTSPVRIQAQALKNLFDHNYHRPTGGRHAWLLLLAAAGLAGQFALVRNIATSLALLSLQITTLSCTFCMLLEQGTLWLPLAALAAASATAWLAGRAVWLGLDLDSQQQTEFNF